MPVYADEPRMYFFWTEYEAFPFIAICIAGIVSRNLTLAIIAGFIYIKLVRKYSEGKPRNFVKHWLYWRGLFPLTSFTLRNPFIRRYF